MQEIDVKHWCDFDAEIQRLGAQREAKTGRSLKAPLFRGLGNSEWGLQTTLERSYPQERIDETLSFRKYYWKADAAKPAVETLTGEKWDAVPDFVHLDRWLKEGKHHWLNRFLNEQPAIYEYLVYLRHHGFPSPLLDWTASPYVAALFAFDAVCEGTEEVCIYEFLQDTIHADSTNNHLFIVGPYIRSHRRHFSQQSRYSMCVRLELEQRDYLFCPHEQAIPDAAGPNGDLFKFRIPAKERLAVLKHLDLMNINPFSVLGSEDSLVRTIARRECLFRDWDL